MQQGWLWQDCQCKEPLVNEGSPVVLDVAGNGFKLTSFSSGVNFDLDGDGVAEQISWTVPNSDDGWLVLDRNGNGTIDNGDELFGNFTAQAPSPAANGFLALAEFDRITNGGNNNGIVDSSDAVFERLHLWRDINHNGISEPAELGTLATFGIKSIELDYKESKRTDEYGNQFRYRAKVRDVKDGRVDRWAWDVFLITQP